MGALFRVRLISRWRSRMKYPGLGISNDVNFDIRGDFVYGAGSGIGAGSNVIIPERATLILGDGCYIGRYVELGPGGCIHIHNHTSIQDRCIFLGDVILSRYCTVAPNVYISSGRHYFDLQPTALITDQDCCVAQNNELLSAHSKPVLVEEDCWLGINVVVMAGVTIGKGAVIGANAVVTKDVAPYTVVAGVPARMIKKRLEFSPPRSIIHSNPNDRPYFYEGFEISEASLEKYAAYGGIATLSKFVLCLDASSGSSIHIVVRNTGSHKCVLTFGRQQKEISSQFEEVVFSNDEHSIRTSRFNMRTGASANKLIIQKAWVQ